MNLRDSKLIGTTLALGALTLGLVACGGSDASSTASNGPAPANLTAVSLAEKAGCSNTSPVADTELFIQDAVDCTDPAWASDSAKVSFYVFGNNDGRDGWLQLAQTFGDKGVVKGDRWVVEIPDDLSNLDSVTAQITSKLAGERVS